MKPQANPVAATTAAVEMIKIREIRDVMAPNVITPPGRGQRCVGRRTATARRAITLPGMEVTIRRARTIDVPAIRRLIDAYSSDRRLLSKATVAIYEDIQEFWVAQLVNAPFDRAPAEDI